MCERVQVARVRVTHVLFPPPVKIRRTRCTWERTQSNVGAVGKERAMTNIGHTGHTLHAYIYTRNC